MAVLKYVRNSLFVLTSSYALASGTPLTIPCTKAAVGFAADALYLQPSSTANSHTYTTFINPQGQLLSYPNPWAWGFHLAGFYHYAKGSDINVNWTHFAPASTKVLPFAAEQLTASNDPRWDGVHFELGETFALTAHKLVRPHAGFEYARIVNTAVLTADNALIVTQSNQVTTYNGFGPRVGVDWYYLSDYGIALYAKAASALLAGTSQFSTYNLVSEFGGLFATLQAGAVPTVVPELEGKLGVTYDYALPQGHLLLDVGWLWVDYFNAESAFSTSPSTVVNGDFSVQGVSLGLKWQGNAL